MMRNRAVVAGLFCCVTVLSFGASAVAADDKEALAFFEAKIRPVLVEHCYKCHSAEAQTKNNWKGELLLDSREGTRVGGKTGPAVVPGDVKASLLISALRQEEFAMPPSAKLSDAVIADFEQWVRNGAADPRDGQAPLAAKGIDLERGRKFWSFQPLKKSPPPQVQDAAWPRNEIDRFVAARLDTAGLHPVADADPYTLVRRVYFDLTGLPPTAEEVADFVSEFSSSPDLPVSRSAAKERESGRTGEREKAYEALVDKLLASPQFGERWGRHWLDVARYAESTGQTPVGIYRYAWRYRDYVVDAFNHDKPYDQFVREQIAGDLLTSDTREQRNERLIATGFLAIGPRNLAENNPLQYVMENVNEQIETISQVFLGLSVGCARCHDHKFDPIPAADYYALAGILRSSELMIGPAAPRGYFGKASKLLTLEMRESDPQYAAHQAALQQETELIAQMEKNVDEIGKIEPQVVATVAKVGGVSGLTSANLRGVLAAKMSAKSSGNSTAMLSPEAEKKRAELVRVGTIDFKELNKLKERKAGLATDSQEYRDLRQMEIELTARLEKIKADYEAVMKSATAPAMKTSSPMVMVKETQSTPESKDAATTASVDKLKAELATLVGELEQLRRKHPAPAAMGVGEAERPQDSPLYTRGNIESPGETVPRGFLQVVHVADYPVVPSNACGRKELADWLTRPDHPLTARVMVNRIWQHLFGAGLVATPNDFGSTGEPPTHPELLDFLAVRFQDEGWSVKQMIRTIMLSRAYRLSTAHDEANLAGDPENRLLWRANRRRLEVEAIRDAVLAIGGQLDLERPTVSPLANVDKDLIERKLRQDGPSVDPSIYATNHRTIYIPIIREEEPRLLTLFDFPNTTAANGQRSTTSVATQALFMMNNPFVIEQARHAAERLLDVDGLSSAKRVDLAYRRILSRPADEREQTEGAAYIDAFRDGTKPVEAWTNFCQILLSGAEFRHLN